MAATGLLYLAILTAFGMDLVARACSPADGTGVRNGAGSHGTRMWHPARTLSRGRGAWADWGHAAPDLERIHQLRAGQHPGEALQAVSRKTVSFNQIDTRTGARIKMKQVSAVDGTEVPDEAIVKGYELPSGKYVLIDRRRARRARSRGVRARSTSRSSSTSTRSIRSSTTPPTTSRPTRRPRSPTRCWRGDGGDGQGRHRPLRDAHQAVPRRGPPQGRHSSCSRRWSTPTRSSTR